LTEVNQAARLERKREYARRYRAANPEKHREWTRRYRETHREALRERRIAIRAAQRAADRTAVFDHYGWFCACCGATDDLTIDHVNGDGTQHRAETRMGRGTAGTYRWLIRSEFPAEFQTLCSPCNLSKGTGKSCRLDHKAVSA
jgi:5-methylcytosine-specific restriction endonuclease McrA